MRTNQGEEAADLAARLDLDHIHVWRLCYDRARQRAPLRALLGAYLGLSADDVTLVEGEHGRPELAAPLDRSLQFNWSHSGGMALVAVARGCAPGIDVEQRRPRRRAMQLAERFFHPEETAALARLNESEREQAFLQLWTAKEAVLKALGRGIAFGLDRLQLAVGPAAPQLLWLDGDDASHWQLRSLSSNEDHVACLAWRGSARSIGYWTLADGQ